MQISTFGWNQKEQFSFSYVYSITMNDLRYVDVFAICIFRDVNY